MTTLECVILSSSNHYRGRQVVTVWCTTRTWDSCLMMKTSFSLMNRIRLCTTIQARFSVLCKETTWFVSMAHQAKLRHRRSLCWSITESVRTATGLSLWCRRSRLHSLIGSLKTMCKCSSYLDLRSFLTLFFYSVRTIWFLNLLQKESGISLLSR